MDRFAHLSNILHIDGTFCTLMERFAQLWNVLQVWDEEMEAIAQRWTDQCDFGHDGNR